MTARNFLLFIIMMPIIACKQSKNDSGKQDKQPVKETADMDMPVDEKEKKKNITDRDYSITPDVAYNDIFLDSMAMENYITQRSLADKKIARRIRSFYNARNYQYGWFSSDGLSEQARFFWNQYDYAVTHLKDSNLVNSEFYKNAEKYLNQEKVTVSTKDINLLNTELGFTEHFIRFINSTYEKGYVKRKEQEKFIPIKKNDPVYLADSLLNKEHSDDKYYEQVNEMYAALKNNLRLYIDIEKAGGFPNIPFIKGTLKKGATEPVIKLVKQRLRLSKDLPGNDTSTVFNDSLELAIKKFEKRHGYKEDGVITPEIIREMNVSAARRLMQILLNMDRMRWMPQKPAGNLIVVNIPEFILHVYDGKSRVFDMVVVVGKVGNNTMMFNGELSYIVFSPYWNVPPSIIKNEILPAMQRDPNYLARKNMEKAGNGIRQKPGPGNALGKVKFIFPNSFNMYFHDTPSKSFFSQDKRAFSHGCIRLSEPQKMAEWLLRNDPEWNREKIVAAMNQTSERMVQLKQQVPVFIIYYTAWVDDDGLLNFRDDVYQHDSKVIKRMFTIQPPVKLIKADNLQVSGTN
ncbi:MAG TPA: L,D-transpeptidase family protein [Chitinophagaceae bacterium]|nr:L,D-transpeptidase family protein [Chitinophagaceae bacterium]